MRNLYFFVLSLREVTWLPGSAQRSTLAFSLLGQTKLSTSSSLCDRWGEHSPVQLLKPEQQQGPALKTPCPQLLTLCPRSHLSKVEFCYEKVISGAKTNRKYLVFPGQWEQQQEADVMLSLSPGSREGNSPGTALVPRVSLSPPGLAALAFCSSPVLVPSSASSRSSSCARRFLRKTISVWAQSNLTCHSSSANKRHPGLQGG